MTSVCAKSNIDTDLINEVTELVAATERDTLISAVKLSAEAVDGLFPEQIKLMKSTVVDVNAALNVTGSALRSAMQDLVTLKSNIGHGNWRAFLRSGCLNIPERAASELVTIYLGWLGTDEGASVPDYVLASMTPRTLAVLAGATTEVRNEALAIVIGGGKLTEAEVRKMVGSKKRRTPEQKALTEALKEISNKAGKEQRASISAEEQDEMRTEADNYLKVASLVKLIKQHLNELKDTSVINFESELIKSYEIELTKAGSKKMLSRDCISFMYLARALERPEYNEMIENTEKLLKAAQGNSPKVIEEASK